MKTLEELVLAKIIVSKQKERDRLLIQIDSLTKEIATYKKRKLDLAKQRDESVVICMCQENEAMVVCKWCNKLLCYNCVQGEEDSFEFIHYSCYSCGSGSSTLY